MTWFTFWAGVAAGAPLWMFLSYAAKEVAMSNKRKVTVQVSIVFEEMMMESTDDAIAIIKGVMVTHGRVCEAEIKQALDDAGARDVTVKMIAF